MKDPLDKMDDDAPLAAGSARRRCLVGCCRHGRQSSPPEATAYFAVVVAIDPFPIQAMKYPTLAFTALLAAFGAEAYVPSKSVNSIRFDSIRWLAGWLGRTSCETARSLLPFLPRFLVSLDPCTTTEAPKPSTAVRPVVDIQKAVTGAFAAFTIASSVITTTPPPAQASLPHAAFSSSQVVAEKVIREGVYGEYEVEVPKQVYDDARSTFKAAKETKSKKGKS